MEAASKTPVFHTHVIRRNTYLACEDLDATWDLSEVKKFDRLWIDGHHIESIAELFGRKVDEILLLIIDRANRGKIEAREGGVFGCLERKNEKAIRGNHGNVKTAKR